MTDGSERTGSENQLPENKSPEKEEAKIPEAEQMNKPAPEMKKDPAEPPVQPPALRPVPKGNGLFTFFVSAGIMFGAIIAGVIIFAVFNGINTSLNRNSVPEGAVEASEVSDPAAVVRAPRVKPRDKNLKIEKSEESYDGSDETKLSEKVYKDVSQSIVCITSYQKDSNFIEDALGVGSGIILTEDGYILTNSHVVNDSVDTGIMVSTSDGREYLGTIIGIDKKTDIALVKIKEDGLTPARIADSDNIKIGQTSFAIGAPGGTDFEGTMTKGMISAVNRTLDMSYYVRYIQTDTPINPGNSGGALINENGEVVGMVTAKIVATGFEGMSFAIPSNKFVKIAEELEKSGGIKSRAYLGIMGKSSTVYMSKVHKIPQGLMIESIESNSSLKNTDVKKNDIITSVDGKEVKDMWDILETLEAYKPGDEVTLDIYRPAVRKGDKTCSFKVRIRLIGEEK